MTLTKEIGRRGGRYHTRYWDLGDGWEMCARKMGSYYIWEAYRLDSQCLADHWPTFYSKAEALAFHKAAA
tara:strand:+ start:33 stop:242 length:210 start_codon:yes stop_codon:yes gene_type:complete